MRFKYAPEHLEFLRTGYRTMNVRDLTAAFNRRFALDKTECCVHSALANHKIRCGRKPKDRLVSRRLRIYTDEQANQYAQP